MNQAEYHLARAEDYAQNFHSLRAVEWQVAFQAYAGYAAIAVAYHSLLPMAPLNPSTLIGWVAIAAALLVFLVTLYTACRVLERMHNTRRRQQEHLDEMYASVYPYSVATESPKADAKAKAGGAFWLKPHTEPIHAKWYAFASQTTISAFWLAGITSYVLYKTGARNLFGQ